MHIFADHNKVEEVEKFKEIILQNPQAKIIFLFDTIDQKFEEESIHLIHDNEAEKTLSSKKKYYLSLDYFVSILKDKIGEKNYQIYKFSTISFGSTKKTKFWTDFILGFKNTFIGTYSLPAETQNFIHHCIKPLYIKYEFEAYEHNKVHWQFLVISTKISGYRIVIFKSGIIYYTEKLSITEDKNPEKTAREIEKNIIKLKIKLKLNTNDKSDLIIIVSKEIKASLENLHNKFYNIVITTPTEIAEKSEIRISEDISNGFADELILSTLSKEKFLYPIKYRSFISILRLEKIIFFWKRAFLILPFILMLFFALKLKDISLKQNIVNITLALEQKVSEVERAKLELKLMAENKITKQFIPLAKELSTQEISPLEIIAKLRDIKHDNISINAVYWEDRDKYYDSAQATITIYIDFRSDSANKNLFEQLNAFISKMKRIFPNYNLDYSRNIENELTFDIHSVPLKITLTGPIDES